MILKKIIIFSVLFFSFYSFVYANNSKLTQNLLKNHIKNLDNNYNVENYIFKIKSYKHNTNFNFYREDKIWSAILIWNNELLTNAHVVLDDNNEISDFLVACYNKNSKTVPDCNYFVNVKYVDIDNDLAILWFEDFEISTWKYSFDKSVKFYNKEVKIQEDTQIYWYPTIWWDTITFSKWKISWFSSNWDIKTDALIDSGNSWWWVFIDNKLIWISSYIISNHQSIWYIKPLKVINEFIKNKDKFKVVSDVNLDFKLYYLSISLYKDWLWTYNKGWLNVDWILKDFKLNEIIYNNAFSFLNYYWEKSNEGIYIELISTRVFNRNKQTNKQLVDWISEVLYPNLKKECFTISNIHLGCNVYYNSDWDDYLKFVWFDFLEDNLFITSIDSIKSNWKTNKDLLNIYLDFYKKLSFSTMFNSNINSLGDFNLSSMSDFTKILFPIFYNDREFKIVLLNKNDSNIISCIDIINNQQIKDSVNLWYFKYENYIDSLKNEFSKLNLKLNKINPKLQQDNNWNYYVFIKNDLIYSYIYFWLDWYIYNTIISLKKDSSNSKINIMKAMNNFNLLTNLKTTTDLKKLDFSQKIITDLDDKWYLYEDTLINWDNSWYWEMYYIPSKNSNIEVINWKILLKNNNFNRHINIAQDIIFDKNLLNKWLIFNLKPISVNYNSKIYVKMIVFSKNLKSENNYYSYTYKVTKDNIEFIKTDKIWDLVSTWRKVNNLSNDVFPDNVRISIGISNTASNYNYLIIDNINLYE